MELDFFFFFFFFFWMLQFALFFLVVLVTWWSFVSKREISALLLLCVTPDFSIVLCLRFSSAIALHRVRLSDLRTAHAVRR